MLWFFTLFNDTKKRTYEFMMDVLFPIALFPEGSLASSVIVPVWIGVMVVAFFNLRFGWVLSGLVVPGYIVPMLLVDPIIAIVNFVEAGLTYLICVFISNKSATWLGLSHFFGRDRFLLIVIVCIVVRLTMDTWLFDLVAQQLQSHTNTSMSFRNHLHSFGLVIIALMANQMWKTGLIRGSWHIGVTVAITFLFVRYGLMTLTNFSITNLAFLYEEVSVAILASPKSYIILLCSCFIASRMNLKYGWEYAGILVPSLLAIQWYQPFKIVVTFVETFFILGLASLLLQSRFVSNMDITGARKLMLFFTISFVFKFVMATSLGVISPFEKASDYYAFGYLLSTLIALKMHDKGLAISMSRTVLQSSLVAVIFATIIGFGLSQIQLSPLLAKTSKVKSLENDPQANLQGWLISKKAQAYVSKNEVLLTSISSAGIDRFRTAIKHIIAYRNDNQPLLLSQAESILNELGANLRLVENDFLVIDHPDDVTFGNYVISLKSDASPLLIQVPRGIAESSAYETGLAIFKLSNAGFLAISNGQTVYGGTDLTNGNSVFNHFQMLTVKNNVLQVRTTARDIHERAKKWSRNKEIMPRESYIWIKNRLPSGLNLALFDSIIADIGTYWGSPVFTNRARELSQVAFAEWLLDKTASTKIIALAKFGNAVRHQEQSTASIEGYLNEWLMTDKLQIAAKHSEAYQEPKLGEALFILEEAVLKIQELIDLEFHNNQWSDSGKSQLDQINSALAYFNYQLIEYIDISRNARYLLLTEKSDHQPKYWGTYVFRVGSSSMHVVEVPRPLYELRTYEYGLHLFESLNARALLIAGAHPLSNKNQSSDVIKVRNLNSLFNITHYGLASYFGDVPLQFTQLRSLPENETNRSNPEIDVLIDYTDNYQFSSNNNPLLTNLTNHFEASGLRTEVARVGVNNAGANLGLYSQSAQLRYQVNKQFAVAWLSSELRDSYKQGGRLRKVRNQLLIVGIDYVSDIDVPAHINQLPLSDEVLSQKIVHNIDGYIASNDITHLSNLATIPKLHLSAYTDRATKQLYLQIDVDGKPLALSNLNSTKSNSVAASSIDEDLGEHFVSGRYRWLRLDKD